MNKFYKRFLILIVLVLVISGTVIYTTVDINTLKNLTQFKTWSIALAILAVSLGLFLDGSRLMYLVKISDEKITLYQAVYRSSSAIISRTFAGCVTVAQSRS